MKIISGFIYFLIFIYPFVSNAQDTNIKIKEDVIENDYNVCYEKLKVLYISYLNSESFKVSSKALDEFKDKVNYTASNAEAKEFIKDSYKENKPLKWIKENIEKTDFKTYQEAELEYQHFVELSKKSRTDNKEFFDYLKTVTDIHGSKIFADAIVYVRLNHPEIFHY